MLPRRADSMKNNLGKVFVVLTTFLSIAFLGFSFSARIAGTNWAGEAAGLENYFVETVPVEKSRPTYTVKHKVTLEPIKAGSKLLPEVILAAYNHEITALNDKIQELETNPRTNLDQIKKQQDEILAHQKVDLKAMQAREEELKQEFDKLSKMIIDLSVEGNKVAQEAQTVWKEGNLRREDVARLRNHLEELEVDHFQSLEQKKRLQDELSRLRGVLARLQRRNVQLKSSYEE
jgi:DNA repair exonuclease SbcCD ATPase subunit